MTAPPPAAAPALCRQPLPPPPAQPLGAGEPLRRIKLDNVSGKSPVHAEELWQRAGQAEVAGLRGWMLAGGQALLLHEVGRQVPAGCRCRWRWCCRMPGDGTMSSRGWQP